jgi:hypothetical protein
MTFAPRALTAAEEVLLSSLTKPLVEAETYASQVALAAATWRADKLGTARTAAYEARPRGDRCVYCQDNEGRDLDHLRPKTLYPLLTFAWTNLIPACSICGGPDHKGAKDAVLDVSSPSGWREITRRRSVGGPVAPPAVGPTAWWNPRLSDPLQAMKLDIVDDSFLFEVIAEPGTPDHARMEWTINTLRLNRRNSLVRQRRSAYRAFLDWLGAVVEDTAAGNAARLAQLRGDLRDRNQPVVWAEMKRQRNDLPDVSLLLSQVPAVLDW